MEYSNQKRIKIDTFENSKKGNRLRTNGNLYWKNLKNYKFFQWWFHLDLDMWYYKGYIIIK